MTATRSCRGCGCTDARACRTPLGPCFWVEADLCSACDPVGPAFSRPSRLPPMLSEPYFWLCAAAASIGFALGWLITTRVIG
jgi:hypothetical protein